MTTLPIATPRLLWQTTIYYNGGNYLLAAFYDNSTRLYYINLLPPPGILNHLIEGLWVHTTDDEATLDDIFCHFFGEKCIPDIRQDTMAHPRLPYEYVRHLITINEISQDTEFYVVIT